MIRSSNTNSLGGYMEQVVAQLTNKDAMKLIAQVENAFKSLPHLPKGIVDFLVMIAPWMAGLGGVLSVIAGLTSLSAGLGMGNYAAMMGYATFGSAYFLLNGVSQLLIAALLLMAFKYLQRRQLTGWVLAFWEMVVSTVTTIVLMVLAGGFSVISIVGILIGFYILFEMKPWYTVTGKAVNAVKEVTE